MSRLVVDSSVAIKWFVPEIHADAALRLLTGGHTLLVPDLLYVEAANILWKRVRRSEMTEEEATVILQSLGGMPLEVHASWPLVMPALEIACRTTRTAYDSLYLALAVREQATMVTADRKLDEALQGSILAPYLCWIEDAA